MEGPCGEESDLTKLSFLGRASASSETGMPATRDPKQDGEDFKMQQKKPECISWTMSVFA